MAVYIVIGLVVLTGLVVAYRSLGRAATQVADPLSTMNSVVDVAMTAAATPTAREAVRASRRRLEACVQQIEAVDAAPLEESAADARALIVVALDELRWWARLCESDAYSTGSGLQRASDALREDALRCLDEASRLLAGC